MNRHVIPLSARRARRPSIAGGKASSLAKLIALGFRVPDGFVVSTSVFGDLLQEHGRRTTAPGGGTDDAAKQLDSLRTSIQAAPLPAIVERDIKTAFRSIGGRVAVRSSLVGEDMPEASFAGQLDSFLDIENEERLMGAIRGCFASALGERCRRYIEAREARASSDPTCGLSMAVLVQRMISARAAGIAFGADPTTGRFCVVIEAVRGSGKDVASGYAIPDRYILKRNGALLESRRAPGAVPALDEAEMRELGRLLRDMEHRFAVPLNVEWAFEGSNLYVLQARPIGTLARMNVYSRSLAADMAPGLIKPLMWSTSVLDMTRNVFQPLFSALLARQDIDGTDLVKQFHSRVYANVTAFAALLARAGLPVNLFEALARDDPVIRPRLRPTPRIIPPLARVARLALRNGRIRGRAESFIEEHERFLDRFRRHDWKNLDPPSLLAEATALRGAHGQTQWFMWTTAMNMALRKKMLASFVRRNAPEVDPASLLAGYAGLRSLEPNERLAEIAESLRAVSPEAAGLAAEGNASLIRERLSVAPGGAGVIAAFDRFMERYGHLSASGTDFTVAPWIETPGAIWGTIGRLAAAPADAHPAREAGAGEKARSRIERRLAWPKRLVFNRLLASAVAYVMMRERMSFLMCEDAYEARRLYLALGDALRSAGTLDAAEEIFYLEFDEIGPLLSGAIIPDTVRALVQSRRDELAADERIDPQDVIFGEPRGGGMEHATGADYLEGIAGSAGIVKGYARVVSDPARFTGAPTPSDVLVVPFMDIGWTPLFRGIGGVIAETGGQLSHSAIIAREYGIPAVVSVAGATRVIRDGQPVTVDGTRGIVYLSHLHHEEGK